VSRSHPKWNLVLSKGQWCLRPKTGSAAHGSWYTYVQLYRVLRNHPGPYLHASRPRDAISFSGKFPSVGMPHKTNTSVVVSYLSRRPYHETRQNVISNAGRSDDVSRLFCFQRHSLHCVSIASFWDALKASISVSDTRSTKIALVHRWATSSPSIPLLCPCYVVLVFIHRDQKVRL
jgi:hypothetical protein